MKYLCEIDLKSEDYYIVPPIMKTVKVDEYAEFVNNYPRKLVRHVSGICDPPAVSYNDFKLADRWPYSVVASGHLWDDKLGSLFYMPKEEREYRIMENYEEVFASRTGNKTD